MKHRRIPRLFVVSGVIFSLLFFGDAIAKEITPSSPVGYDISSPQCGRPYPSSPVAFTIIGVTSGRAFRHNSCLDSEFQWAANASAPMLLYLNLNYPMGVTASKGNTGPAGTCRSADESCKAYNYGYNAAQDALDYAASVGAHATIWFLDIETANSWSNNTRLNARVIQGAIDRFQSQWITVGAYSTKYQWNLIAGSSYVPALSKRVQIEFPIWVPGARNLTQAPNYCSSNYAFGGGIVRLAQYPSGRFDANYICP